MKDLIQFSINVRPIVNPDKGTTFEGNMLLVLYDLMFRKNEQNLFSLLKNDDISLCENNQYISYIKRSKLNNLSTKKNIDIGASNLISILFSRKKYLNQSNFSDLSLPYAYFNHTNQPDVNFTGSNLKKATIYKSNIPLTYSIGNDKNTKLNSIFDSSSLCSFQEITSLNDNSFIAISSNYITKHSNINNSFILTKTKRILSNNQLRFLRKSNNHIFCTNTFNVIY